MSVSIIIPYRPLSAARARNFEFVKNYYTKLLPDAELVVADDPDRTLFRFNRGRALNAGVKRSVGEVLVFADTDYLIEPLTMLNSMRLLEPGVGMVVPYTSVYFLTEDSTHAVCAGLVDPFNAQLSCIDSFDSLATGGFNILTRETFLRVGGFDERHLGWGYEDASFAGTVQTLVGPIEWAPSKALHLNHEINQNSGTEEREASLALCKRYEQAWGNADAMESLVRERSLYCIKPNYNHRFTYAYFDDTVWEDQFQDDVYKEAGNLIRSRYFFNKARVLDMGCGSSFKAKKHGLHDTDYLGVDVPETVEWLQSKYGNPTLSFMTFENLRASVLDIKADVVVCSDAVEHTTDPWLMMELCYRTGAEWLVLSTPERDLLRGVADHGPPLNHTHTREWNTQELLEFLSPWWEVRENKVVDQVNMTNLVIARRKA